MTDIDRLPSLPHSLLALLDITSQEQVPVEKLATLLRRDASLLLRVCTAMYHAGFNADKTALERPLAEMLQQLDQSRLKSIATNACTQQFFSRLSNDRTEFIKHHWQHSLLCANVAEILCDDTDYDNSEEVFKAGLLHDIGQLVMESAFPDTYTQTFASLSEEDYFPNLEREQFETTHQEVGAELLRKHGCDPFIVDAVLYHHEHRKTLRDAHPIVRLVHVANLLSCEHFNELDTRVFVAAEELLGLGRETLLRALNTARNTVSLTAEAMEIELRRDGMNAEQNRQVAAREQNKQLKLAEQVRNIALLDSLHQYVSYVGTDKLTAVVNEQCQLLFGINNSVLFVYDESEQRLRALGSDCHRHLDAIALPLQSGRSMVADALLQRTMVDSYATIFEDICVVDRQLIDLFAGNGMVCVPMLLDNQPVGSLVLVVNELEHRSLLRQQVLLQQFAQALAHIIATSQTTGSVSASDARAERLHRRMREVAHEIRNPLSIINNYLEILGVKLGEDNPAQSDIGTVKSEIERIGSIMEKLSDDGQQVAEASDIDVNALIVDLTGMMQSALPGYSSIQIQLDLDEGLGPVTTQPDAIKQIYTNLVKNAIEALGENGEIMVYTQDNVNVDGHTYVELAISDNGPGIDATILPKLFSPVETTKQGDHAGLGLTIVKNLVDELHGSIRCRSSHRGTSFTILLPR